MNIKLGCICSIIFVISLIPSIALADIDEIDDTFSIENIDVQTASSVEEIPSINARHAVVLDRLSGTILYGKNETEKCKMASTTKIMTAIVVLENCSNLDAIVTVSSTSAHTGRFKIRSFK